ncbi:glycosyltransferase family 1 protein [Niallia circulans]|uniref:Glycosyltransferase family 1 protein n=1 Tax=Niallia circulans TaxID=1397 RepID=A0A553SIL2_NIACI|nr:glycosyltransferase family 4 protein [Niallia circulans]TRZ36829.1 glycosyltransferase family 1 protein [Niallia circulans]
MKIAILCNEAKPVPAVEGGAVETLVDLLIQNNEDSKILDIDVITVHNEKAIIKSENYLNTSFKFIKYNKGLEEKLIFMNKFTKKFKVKFWFHEYLKEAVKVLNQNDYDWIIVENRPIYIKYLKNKLPNKKFALHLHNDTLSVDNYYSKFCLDKYDKILTVSEYITRRVVEVNPKLKEKVVTLLNRIDTNKFGGTIFNKDSIREKYNITDEEKIILYHGRIIKEKGVLELIKAFNLANAKQKKLKLIVIGEVSGSKYFERRIAEEINKGQENRIIMTGYVDHELLPQYLNSSDIVVLPSLWNEPFGLTIVESMAMEKPVISVNVGAIPEIILEDCGILVNKDEDLVTNLAQAIYNLSENSELMRKFGENSKKRAISNYNSVDYLKDLVMLLD